MAAVVYHTFIPQLPLKAFVELFWLYEGSVSTYTKEHLLPHGTAEIIINLREDELRFYDRQREHLQRFRGILLCGVHSTYSLLDMKDLTPVMGIRFKAGGAFPFFKMPASELYNTTLSLETLWGTAANDLRDRLLDAHLPEIRFRLLEQALFAHAVSPLRHHPAVSFALSELQMVPHRRTLSEMSGQLGLSRQKFLQVFRDEVGLTPKLFSRIRRFREILLLIKREPHIDWVNFALDCGYFDQAHLAHDFRAFAGLAPSTYLLRRSGPEQINHIAHDEKRRNFLQDTSFLSD